MAPEGTGGLTRTGSSFRRFRVLELVLDFVQLVVSMVGESGIGNRLLAKEWEKKISSWHTAIYVG